MVKGKNHANNTAVSGDMSGVVEQIRQVKFWYYVTFGDTISRYLEITMKKDDISPLHAMAMYHLVCAGGVTTPTQLADKMFRSKHSVTKIVDNLEKEGFIVRDFSSKDRRVTQIRITAAGLEYTKNNQSKGNLRANRSWTACLSKNRKH